MEGERVAAVWEKLTVMQREDFFLRIMLVGRTAVILVAETDVFSFYRCNLVFTQTSSFGISSDIANHLGWYFHGRFKVDGPTAAVHGTLEISKLFLVAEIMLQHPVFIQEVQAFPEFLPELLLQEADPDIRGLDLHQFSRAFVDASPRDDHVDMDVVVLFLAKRMQH